MIRCDALVVGGGPAGSTCARILRRAGWNVVVADRAAFPRDKVCAGWLTPDVFPLLELEPAEYRATGHTLQTIAGFRTGLVSAPLIETRYPRTVSYAIRRCEFDTFLLRRSGARLLENMPVTTLRRSGATWIVDDAIETPIVVGAGGHFCPVARHLQKGHEAQPPVVAKEAEFRVEGEASRLAADTPELFFCDDLEGYGWCVRKGEYLNVGIGRRDRRHFNEHVDAFAAFLERRGVLSNASTIKWRGHAYLASGTGPSPLIGPGVLLAGDAAGLAYPESGEGIKPAIESGRLAAEAIVAAQGATDEAALLPYAEALRRRHPAVTTHSAPVRAAFTAIGRYLLASPLFTRHVVLDRWFLRRA